MATTVTLAQLRRAAPAGAVVKHETTPLGGEYVALAPDGQRFTEGPHLLLECYCPRLRTRAEARAALLIRLAEAELEACTDPDCGCADS